MLIAVRFSAKRVRCAGTTVVAAPWPPGAFLAARPPLAHLTAPASSLPPPRRLAHLSPAEPSSARAASPSGRQWIDSGAGKHFPDDGKMFRDSWSSGCRPRRLAERAAALVFRTL
jgi:hypothetical protein